MAILGVRELRERASEIIRRAREERAECVVTYQGRPVAVFLSLDTAQAEAEIVATSKRAVLTGWEEYRRLAADMLRAWPTDVSTQDVLDDIRR